jgi:hypothetical protein
MYRGRTPIALALQNRSAHPSVEPNKFRVPGAAASTHLVDDLSDLIAGARKVGGRSARTSAGNSPKRRNLEELVDVAWTPLPDRIPAASGCRHSVPSATVCSPAERRMLTAFAHLGDRAVPLSAIAEAPNAGSN